ncbi:MAG TPA: peptidoglycan recognition protein, partial [Kineosporiaceae bacterium]|nr:peptidoglycan recognition protein [Kineosporiaceae bacterium]
MQRWRSRTSARSQRPLRCGVALLAVVGLASAGAVAAAVHVGVDRPDAVAAPAGSGPVALSVVDPAPIRPTLHTIALADTVGDRAPAVPARRTNRFTLVGVTWSDPHARLDATLQLRTRSATTGKWRDWSSAPGDEDRGDDDRRNDDRRNDDRSGDAEPVRGGREPIWVGDSDSVQVRFSGTTGSRLPAGLRLDLIDPGRAETSTAAAVAPVAYTVAADSTDATPSGPAGSPAATSTSSQSSSSSTSSTPSATSAPSSTQTLSSTQTPLMPAPSMVTRAGWNADESLRRAPPLYAGAVKVVFVHHTAGADEDCSRSSDIVRGLYAYHVSDLGWNDLGYNFLVDRCGTLFEGRSGGADRPVIGAQTYGFNTDSTGVAIIGTFTTTGASPAALATVARLAAWKLAIGGISPSATSTLVEGASDSHGFVGGATHPFAAISGHRDGYATECPGEALYAQLPALRDLATADAAGTGLSLSGITGAIAVGGRYYTKGQMTISWADSAAATAPPAGYLVLVDGLPVLNAAPDARSAVVSLSDGSHTVAVQGDYPTTPAGSAATLITATVAVISD